VRRLLLVHLLLLLATTLSAETKDLKADFGAVGDGVTDDTVAIQAGLDWVASAHDVLTVPVGFYRVTSTLALVQKANFRVSGPTAQVGVYNTAFRWYGPAGGTMLLLDGVRDSEWTDIAFDAVDSSGEPAVLIDIDKITAGTYFPRKNAFRRMILRGGSVAAVRMSNTAQAGNEANLFEDVGVYGVPGSIWVNGVGGGGYGYWVRNVNSKNNQIVRGSISHKDAAVYAEQGSIHLHSVEISQSNVWVRKGGGGEPIIIENCDGDSSKTFLELLTTQTGPVIATGNRFYPHYDGPQFILGDTIGPVTLIGNEFANGGYKGTVTTQIAGNGPNLIAIGNTFPNDTMLPVPGQTPPKLRSLYALGNAHYTPGNVVKLSNDYLIPYRQSGASVSSLQVGGASGFRGETQSINQAALTINSNQAIVPVTPTANFTLTSLPSIRPGMFEGQELKIVNVGSFAFGLMDQLTLPGTQLSMTTPTLTLAPRASVSFIWTASYGGRWIQVSPVVSPL
jgi:hypothetical protein